MCTPRSDAWRQSSNDAPTYFSCVFMESGGRAFITHQRRTPRIRADRRVLLTAQSQATAVTIPVRHTRVGAVRRDLSSSLVSHHAGRTAAAAAARGDDWGDVP